MKKPRLRYVLLAGLLVLVLIGALVQVPLVALGPGPTFNTLGTTTVEDKSGKRTVPVIDITGLPEDSVDGSLDMTTVNVLSHFTGAVAVRLIADKNWTVVPRSALYPRGVSDERIKEQQSAEMAQSENAAIVAALRHLQLPISTVIAGVSRSAPAHKLLRPGDHIVSVNGQSITVATDVHKALKGTRGGQHVPVSVLRDGIPMTFSVPLIEGSAQQQDRGLLGIILSSVPGGDVGITIHLANVGGPSAGLMFTLAIIDKLSPGSLTGGQHIAGTGTMSYDGTVGPIGGIGHKLVGARRAGATVFLVPQQNCAAARQANVPGLTLVRVISLDDALSSLQKLQNHQSVPLCPQ